MSRILENVYKSAKRLHDAGRMDDVIMRKSVQMLLTAQDDNALRAAIAAVIVALDRGVGLPRHNDAMRCGRVVRNPTTLD